MTKTKRAPFRRAVRALVLVVASFCLVALFLFYYSRPRPFDESEPPPTAGVDYKKSFKWSDSIPHLYRAAALSSHEAVRLLLHNTLHLRTYVAIELQASARPGEPIYDARLGDTILETVITSKIDEVVQERIDSRGTMTSVYYPLPRQPFPFTVITAMKSHNQPYASLIFDLTRRTSLTGRQVETEYGAPQERAMDAQSFILFTYRTETKSYTAKTKFQIHPDSNKVRRVSISVQRKTR